MYNNYYGGLPKVNQSINMHSNINVKPQGKRVRSHTDIKQTRNKIPTNNNINNSIDHNKLKLCWNDLVLLYDGRKGRIKFIGYVGNEYNSIWYGLNLTTPNGIHNGCVRNRVYYKAKKNHGIFVSKQQIKKVITEYSKINRFSLNDKIRINNNGFINNELFYGISLVKQKGNNDGSFNGITYFNAMPYHGIFLKNDQIKIYLPPNRHNINKNNNNNINNYNNSNANTNNNVAYKAPAINDLLPALPNDDNESNSDDNTDILSNPESIDMNVLAKNANFNNILNNFKKNETYLGYSNGYGYNNGYNNGYNGYNNGYNNGFGYDMNNQNTTNNNNNNNVSNNTASNTNTINNVNNGKKSKPKRSQTISPKIPPPPPSNALTEDEQKGLVNVHHGLPQSHTTYDAASQYYYPEYTNGYQQNMGYNNNYYYPDYNMGYNQYGYDPYMNYYSNNYSQSPPPLMQQSASYPSAYPNSAANNYASPKVKPVKPKGKNNKGIASLKQYPDGPFDVRSTEADFYKASELIMASCNNPRGIFKVLKGVCSKLRHNDPKYRVIDPVNPAVQKKLFNYEGTDDFLKYLGFMPDESTQCWICPDDQPPLIVLSAGINVCNELIIKCNEKRSKITEIRKFSKMPKPKGLKIKKPADVAPVIKKPDASTVSIKKPKSPSSISSKDVSYSSAAEDVVTAGNRNDDDLDGDNDRFQLQDIVWSITHQGSKDNDIRNVLLLCHRVFTTSEDILKMLEMRFFSNEGSDMAQWEVQVKVVSLIQHWLRTYWFEDFELQPTMEELLEEFIEKIRDYYQSISLNKGVKLAEMIEKTVQFQKKKLEEIHSIQSAKLSKAKSMKLLGYDPDINKNGSSTPTNKTKDKTLSKKTELELNNEFMKLDNIKIAENITLIDEELFSKVQPRECLSQNWKAKNKEIVAKNICNLIRQFNNVSKWVQCSILFYSKDIKKRGRIIKKWIKIANELFNRKNFQSMSSIQSALNSTPIFRLKQSWKQIPAKHLMKFEEFKVIFKSNNNMGNLRRIHRESHAPMIPYTGIFLQDLFNIDEGIEQYKGDGTVNFAKLMRMHEQIDKLMLLQKTSFGFKKDNKIHKAINDNIAKFKNFQERQVNKFSDDIYAKERKK